MNEEIEDIMEECALIDMDLVNYLTSKGWKCLEK